MSSSGTSSDVNMVDVDFEDQLPAHMQNDTTDARREEIKNKNAKSDFLQSSSNSANVSINNVDVAPLDKSDDALSSSTSLDIEGDAKNTIEMLRGDDISERISAANRLESVAVALGPQRVREVRSAEIGSCLSDISKPKIVKRSFFYIYTLCIILTPI